MKKKHLLVVILISVETFAAFATGKGGLDIFTTNNQLAVNDNSNSAVVVDAAVQEGSKVAEVPVSASASENVPQSRVPGQFRKYDFNTDDYISEAEMQQATRDYQMNHTGYTEKDFARFIDFFFNQ